MTVFTATAPNQYVVRFRVPRLSEAYGLRPAEMIIVGDRLMDGISGIAQRLRAGIVSHEQDRRVGVDQNPGIDAANQPASLAKQAVSECPMGETTK